MALDRGAWMRRSSRPTEIRLSESGRQRKSPILSANEKQLVWSILLFRHAPLARPSDDVCKDFLTLMMTERCLWEIGSSDIPDMDAWINGRCRAGDVIATRRPPNQFSNRAERLKFEQRLLSTIGILHIPHLRLTPKCSITLLERSRTRIVRSRPPVANQYGSWGFHAKHCVRSAVVRTMAGDSIRRMSQIYTIEQMNADSFSSSSSRFTYGNNQLIIQSRSE